MTLYTDCEVSISSGSHTVLSLPYTDLYPGQMYLKAEDFRKQVNAGYLAVFGGCFTRLCIRLYYIIM